MVMRTVFVAVGGAALGLAAGAYLWLGLDAGAPTVPEVDPVVVGEIAVAPPAEVAREVPTSQQALQLSFAPVVRAVAPSVVNVYATTVTQSSSPFAGDPFFERFFGGDFFRSRPRQSQSLGSGVIIEPSGVILTNSHVVSGATDIRVSTADGREFAVDLVLDDARTDLAVLRVRDGGNATFAALAFGDSDALEVGDIVLAIGNPFGVGQTVTSGIVSALARTGVETGNFELFIQTDAAINPGNSGGALVDIDGRLVGINTAIFTRSGGNVGIGFAIPSNMARVVAEAGVAGGQLVRPWFGARLQEVTADIAASVGLGAPRGALVIDVAPASSAARAGFRPGDVIVSIDGAEVAQPSAFDFRLATRPVGSEVTIGYRRGGSEQAATLTLEAPPVIGERVEITGNTRFAGAAVETMTPAMAQELGLAFDARGVVVRDVAARSPADGMGLRPGDVIVSLNGRETTSAEAFRELARGRPNAWQIVLLRDGRTFRTVVSG